MQKLQNKSIAVVGNGGSLIGSDSGEKIDSCDIVIRFNNYDTSLKYRKDVGRKTDIWCNTFYRDIKYRDDHPRIMCPLPLNKKEYLSIYSATNLSFLNEKCSNIECCAAEIREKEWGQARRVEQTCSISDSFR